MSCYNIILCCPLLQLLIILLFDVQKNSVVLGKPGKIQLTVIEEFEMKPKAKNVNGAGGLVFEGYEYRTDEDLNELMNPFIAATAETSWCLYG